MGEQRMSVKVYPYLTKPDTITENTKTTTNTTKSSKENSASFSTVLADANRNLQAIAVDALIAQSETKSVDVETVQRLLGFNPAPNAIVANSKLPSNTVTDSTTTNTSSTKASSAAAKSATESAKTDSTVTSGTTLTCSEELERYFEEAAETYDVDVNLLKAIAKVESNFNPGATSGAGAMGIMQLMPATAEDLGIEDAYDAYDNIMGGAQIIAQNLERYDGDLALALAAYNAGPGNVDKYGGIPPFEETQNYVTKVLEYYENA